MKMSLEYSNKQLEKATAIFKALADPERLDILVSLASGEASVSELAQARQQRLGTVSARLQVLSRANLLRRRRDGQVVLYSLADDHVVELIENALAHADEDHPGHAD
nr:winged helix-turn-helix transcriptional regulator [Oceanococcus sp. HetDA_MAG_MS8]